MNPHRTFVVSLFLLFFANTVFSQNKENDHQKYEFGLNITGTLAGFLNADGIQEKSDPYLLSLKLIKRKNVLRLGLAGSSQIGRETDPVTFNSRNTIETSTRLRGGFERRTPIGKRFIYHWGIDVIGEYLINDVETFGNFGLVTLKQRARGIGAGPVFGMQFVLHPRVTLSTESSFYAIQRFQTEKQNIPPALPQTIKDKNFRFLPILPSSLYLNFRF